MFRCLAVLGLVFLHTVANANPHYDKTLVPKNREYGRLKALPSIENRQHSFAEEETGIEVLRAGVSTGRDGFRFQLTHLVKENSGTEALLKRSAQEPYLGSYRAILRDKQTGKILAYDSIGTGKEYSALVDELTFRFPVPKNKAVMELYAEHPQTGKLEAVLSESFDPDSVSTATSNPAGVEIVELKRPKAGEPSVRVNIYAEGYVSSRRDEFLRHAAAAVSSLYAADFPMVANMHFFAVFAPSSQAIGSAKRLGFPIPEYPTRLGLFFPYWDDFGRWYNVVYPTREEKFREGLAVAPYDYAIILIDDNAYWGVGNFRSITAVPARSSSSVYILLHEFGHYFGLNEEYEGGGRTELEFAPGIEEPWSQNMTFLRSDDIRDLKWAEFVSSSTPLPTPGSVWKSNPPVYGAYVGGYGDSPPRRQSHKPGFSCVMESGSHFCPVCRRAIEDVVRFDVGAGGARNIRVRGR